MADSSSTEIAQELQPFFLVYKDGRVERLMPTDYVPPSEDPTTGVSTKDVVISPENNVSARLFLPKTAASSNQKLPLLVYIHGGGFSVESAFSSTYTNYLIQLVAEANLVAVSVEYRLAPEHSIPACYEDSWAVLEWVASNAGPEGNEPWLKQHADFSNIFVAGDSAGANIAHQVMVQASVGHGGGLGHGVKPTRLALIHPFFGDDHELDSIWAYICPKPTGVDDPRLNPSAHPHLLKQLVCSKVLVCTAGADEFGPRGWKYYEVLKDCGWHGEVKIFESEGEPHVFHLITPGTEKAAELFKQVVSFFK